MEGKWQEKAGLFITIDNKFEIKHFNSIAYRINAAMSKADNDQTNEGENTASFFRHGEPRTVPNNQPICLHILLLLSCHWNTIENRKSRTVWWGIVLGTFSMNGIYSAKKYGVRSKEIMLRASSSGSSVNLSSCIVSLDKAGKLPVAAIVFNLSSTVIYRTRKLMVRMIKIQWFSLIKTDHLYE